VRKYGVLLSMGAVRWQYRRYIFRALPQGCQLVIRRTCDYLFLNTQVRKSELRFPPGFRMNGGRAMGISPARKIDNFLRVDVH